MSAVYTAIRQNSAAYTPLFDKCQPYTHRHSTKVSGRASRYSTSIRQLFDKHDKYVNRNRHDFMFFLAMMRSQHMFAAQASSNSRACQGRKFVEQPRSHPRSSDVSSASIFTSTSIQCLLKNQLKTNQLVQFVHGANLLCLHDSRERMPTIERFICLRTHKQGTTKALKATP